MELAGAAGEVLEPNLVDKAFAQLGQFNSGAARVGAERNANNLFGAAVEIDMIIQI